MLLALLVQLTLVAVVAVVVVIALDMPAAKVVQVWSLSGIFLLLQ
jgi:hypothetical protein